MNEQEREILYKLLIDLFTEKPRQKQNSETKGSQNHEKVSTAARTKRARN